MRVLVLLALVGCAGAPPRRDAVVTIAPAYTSTAPEPKPAPPPPAPLPRP